MSSSLGISDTAITYIVLFGQWLTKTLIRRAGWSASWLFAYDTSRFSHDVGHFKNHRYQYWIVHFKSFHSKMKMNKKKKKRRRKIKAKLIMLKLYRTVNTVCFWTRILLLDLSEMIKAYRNRTGAFTVCILDMGQEENSDKEPKIWLHWWAVQGSL